MIERIQYGIRFNNRIHFPLKIQILITSYRLIIFRSYTIQFYKFHNNLWRDMLCVKLELDLAIKELVGEM